jgi:hypothetical protein
LYIYPSLLYTILDAMNVSICRATQSSPYKLVFGQEPLVRFALIGELERCNIDNEEDIPEGLLRELHVCGDSDDSREDVIEVSADEMLEDNTDEQVFDQVVSV